MGRKKSEFHGKNKCDMLIRSSLKKNNEINKECEKLLRLSSDPSYLNQLWDNFLEISSCLEKIKKLEQAKIDMFERFDTTEEFINWLKVNGAKISNVSIHKFPGYDLGLRAEKDFKENDLILEIPRQLIFNVFTAAPELKDIQNDVLIQNMPQIALAIALLIEKNKDNSKWKPYLKILPKKYTTVLYMSTADMMELKGTSSLESALKQCRNIARQYSYLHKLFSNHDNAVSKLLQNNFTYEEYRWAVSTVMTRQNLIPNEDSSQMVNSLIPMWDMCNHEEGRITTDFNDTSNSCECFAMKDFKSGDQIFIYYGPRTNTEFFVHSGFVYPNNKQDEFRLRLGISKADPLQKERIELLSRLGLLPVNDYSLKPGPELLSGSLLGFLRIFNMNKSELDYWLKSDIIDDITRVDSELGKTLDERVITFITTRLKLLLTNYPASEEDCVQLLSTVTSPCRKLALQMKLSEKNILCCVLENLKKYTKI